MFSVFKTGVSSDPAQAGSIPVRLRYQRISSSIASFVRLIRNRGGCWQVKVYAGRDPLTGKQRFEYDRAKTKREAGRVEAALKTKVAEGRSRGTAARTVADLVERWYEWRQGVREISPTTLEGYRRQIDQRIVPALGRIPVRRQDVETQDDFYAELRRRGKAGGQPLSASTVRAVHTVLSGSLRQAVAWGWIPHNPARLATPPSVQRSDVAPPPVEQVAGLLATALERNPRLGLFLRLAVVLGARRGELCALRRHHIDLDRGEVLLERGVVYVSRQPLIDKPTKTRSKRRLALDTSTVELLHAHRERSEQVARELGFTLPASAYVFSREPDGSRPLAPTLVSHQFAALARSPETCRAYGAMSTRRIASTRRPTTKKPASCAPSSLAKSSAWRAS
jgi:integrase